MKVGLITAQELPLFRSLILPEVAERLSVGVPLVALGLVDESTDAAVACGAAVGWLQEEIFLLQSLYVAPDWRGRGGGRLLVQTLCSLLAGRCNVVEISYIETEPEHQALAQFLEAMAFSPQADAEGEALYGVTVGEVAQHPFFQTRGGGAAHGVRPFHQVPRGNLTQAYRSAKAKGENYLPVPLTDPSVDAVLSMALLHQGAVRSFLAFVHPAPGRISLAWAKSEDAQDLPLLLREAFACIQAEYPPQTWITVQAINAVSAGLVAVLLPNARPLSRTYTRYLDMERASPGSPPPMDVRRN